MDSDSWGMAGEEEAEGPCKVFFKGLILGHLCSGLDPHVTAVGFGVSLYF